MRNSNVEPTIASQWWRWPLVPLASFVAGTAGAFAFGAFFWLSMKLQGGYQETGWMFRYVLPILCMGAFGWLFVTSASWVAPRGKFIVAVVMLTVLILIGLMNLLVHWVFQTTEISEAVRVTFGAVSASFMGILAMIQIHKDA